MLVLAGAYYEAARLSLHLALVRGQVTPIWPPTGVAVVVLLLVGRRMWPGVALGAFAVNAPISSSLWVAAGIAVGNTLAPLVAVTLLKRLGFRTEIDRLRDAVALVFVAALPSMALSATGGSLTLLLSGSVSRGAFLSTWSVWWTGDAVGVLIFAPFLLSFGLVAAPIATRWSERLELIGVSLGLAAVAYAVFRTDFYIQFLPFPFLAWIAWRFGQRAAARASLVASVVAIAAAAHRVGPFAQGSLFGRMVTLQVFNAGVALCSLVLGAMSAERRRHLDERLLAADELAHRALHDSLTGLANRALFMDRLGQALARTDRRPGSMAVMFLDLDHFKVINDSIGHDAGDRVLKSTADRLRMALRPSDTAARFGGDEFLILCEDVGSERDVILIAERLSEAVAQPISLQAGEIAVTTSIGIAMCGGGADKCEDLVRDADSALYRAKELGRARFELFDRAMRARAMRRLTIEKELRKAIDHGQLTLHYQPLVDLRTGAVKEVEALVRWEHPRWGLLLPEMFVHVAEDTGLIVPIGAWVLEAACRQCVEWRDVFPEIAPPAVAVNVSAPQLTRRGFEQAVAQTLERTGMQAGNLVFEVTEGVFMGTSSPTLETLRRLRDLGIRLTIDDFGTGYSSLGYLKRMGADALKVDRTFVDGLGDEPEDEAIVAAIVRLAHSLGLVAVAEGVETADQVGRLRALQCDLVQGFYYSEPRPPDAILSYLRDGDSISVEA
jgi:diguanylate cyclase (GGDEF)-like protein